ncbi:MAG: glycerol acyltransferase, partial [Bacteroidia bacterium]|nr:glycerol acyltransferase [Bacteroidia bacterium]
MANQSDNKGILQIDVGDVLRSKNPSLAKVIPSFLINYLKRIIHQDDINEILSKFGHLKDSEFIAPVLDFMQIKYRVF